MNDCENKTPMLKPRKTGNRLTLSARNPPVAHVAHTCIELIVSMIVMECECLNHLDWISVSGIILA